VPDSFLRLFIFPCQLFLTSQIRIVNLWRKGFITCCVVHHIWFSVSIEMWCWFSFFTDHVTRECCDLAYRGKQKNHSSLLMQRQENL